ncbi:MAG: hypothetical protein ACFFCY_10970 [Promethearchaeota archaeon]
MNEESQLKNYIGLVNLMIFLRWIILIIIGTSLILNLHNSREILLLYSISVFFGILIIEIVITIGISIFKRKIEFTNKTDN